MTAKDAATKVIAGFGKELGGLGGLAKVATVGMAAIATAGAGLTAGLVSSIGAAMDFESAMSAVAAVAGGSDADLKRLSDTAIQLGQDTTLAGVGATDAATAMRELAAAGLSVDDIVGGAALGALRLASAGGIDVARAAEIAAMAIANFGLEGKDAAHVADLFASAANSSAISVEDIAEAMKYVGPIADSMGLSIEDVTATIAALGNQGIKGSQAGTALRSMFVSLAKPSEKAADLIRDLGLEFFDTAGHMKSIGGISEELKTKLSGLSDKQRAATLATLFGNEALTAATVLYGEGAAGIAKWLNEIQNGATAAQVGALRNDNLKGSIEALKSSFETAQIVLGTAFLPALKQLADLATQGVNAAIPFLKVWGPQMAAALSAGLGMVPTLVQRAATAFSALGTAIRALAAGDINGMFGPLLAAIEATFGPDAMARAAGGLNLLLAALERARTVVGMAREAFAQLPMPVQQLIAGFVALGPAVRIVAVALPLLVGALTGLGPIISFLTATIPLLGTVIAALGGPLTIAIAAVAALGIAWATNWLGIRDQTMPIITQIVAFVTGTLIPGLQQLATFTTTVLVPQLMAGWAQIQATIATAVAAILPTLQQFAAWFSAELLPAVQAAAATIVPAVTQLGQATLAAFQAALPGMQAFIGGMQQLGAAVIPILGAVAAQIQGTLGPAVLAIVGWAQEVIPQFAAAWSNVMSIVGPIVGQLASMIGAALSAIAGYIESHSAQIQAILTNAWQAMSNMIGAVLTLISGLISTTLLVISGDWEGAWNRLVETVTTAGQQFTTAINSAMAAIVIAMATGMADLLGVMQSAWSAIVAGAASGMGQLASTVAAGVGALPGIALSIAGAMYAAGVALISNFVQGIASKMGEAIQVVRDGIQQIANLLPGSEPKDSSSPLRGLAERGAAIFGNLLEGIEDAAPEAVKAVADAASAMAKAITDTLGAMKALADFDFANDSPTGDDMGWFTHLTTSLIQNFADAAAQFEADALEQTGKFADTVGKVGGAVKNAVEGLTALAKANWADSSPDGNAMSWFTHLVVSLVQNFVEAGASFEEDGLESANRFADTVGKVTGVIKGAIEGLDALKKFSAPAEEKVSAFMRSLADLMEKFGTWAGGFEADGLAQSSIFAEAVGKVVGVLDNGVKGLMALTAFVAPAEANVTAFMTSLSDLMEKFGTWAGGFEADVLAATSTFAEAAGKVAGVIGPAVDGFAKLATLAAPSESAISNLAAGIRAIVAKFAAMARELDAEGTKATGDFAEAAGKALGAAKTGVELFAAMAGDKDKAGNNVPVGIPSATAIDQLVAGIRYVIGKFREMATQMEEEGIKQMQAFASAAGQVLSAAKTGTDLFKSFEKLAIPAKEAIDNLLGGIGYVINKTREIAGSIGGQGLTEAQSFATGALQVFSTIKAALENWSGMDDIKDIPAKALEALYNAMQPALDWAHKSAQSAATLKGEAEKYLADMQAAARAFAEGMALGNGIGGRTGVGPTVPTAPSGVGGPVIGEFARAGGGGGAGGTVNVTIAAPVYGVNHMEDVVVRAVTTAQRRGRL